MSLENVTQAGASPFCITGTSTAASAQTITIPADTVLQQGIPNSIRQIVVYALYIVYSNNTVTAVAASAVLTVTTTGFQNTPTFPVTNGIGAWSTVVVPTPTLDSSWGGMSVPLVGNGAAQNPATIVIPAGGTGVVSYCTVCGVYV